MRRYQVKEVGSKRNETIHIIKISTMFEPLRNNSNKNIKVQKIY